MKKKRLNTINIIISLLVLFLLLFDFTFRNDESFTLALIHHSFKNLIQLDSFDVHPPLYYLLLKLFLDITTFYTSSIFVKIIFSRIFSFLATIIGLYYLTKLIPYKEKTKYNIIILFMLIPSVLCFSTQIRMYSLAGMFLSLEFYTVNKFIISNKNRYILYCLIVTLCGAYTDYFTAVSAGFMLLVVLIRSIYNKCYIKGIKVTVVGFILLISYLPWYYYSIILKIHAESNMNSKNVMLLGIKKSIINVIQDITGIHDSAIGLYGQLFKHFVVIIMFIVICFCIYYSFKHLNKDFNTLLLEALVTFILTASLGSLSSIMYHQYAERVIYPIFFINAFLFMNIVIYMCRYYHLFKQSLIFFNILILSILLVLNLSGSIYYELVNVYQSIGIVRDIHTIKLKNKLPYVYNRNNNISGFMHSQPLLSHKHQFYLCNKATYLYYMNKPLYTNKLSSKNSSPIQPNGTKIEKYVWPNLRIKKI